MGEDLIDSSKLEEYFNLIIEGKESIRSISAQNGIPRSTLSRMIDKNYKGDSRYLRYKIRLEQYQHSGGNIQPNEIFQTYGDEKKLKKFFEDYCEYKAGGMKDSEIIEKMSLSKASFYRKLKAYKVLVAQGTIQLKKEEFMMLPDYIKEEIIFGKANDRRAKANISRFSRSDFQNNLIGMKEFFLQERNQKVTNEKYFIRLADMYYLLYANVALVATTTVDRTIRAHMENIDRIIGADLSNIIIKNKPYILTSSEQTVEQLLCIAIDYNILDKYITAKERMAPDRLYALIQYSKMNGIEQYSLGEIDKKAMQVFTKEELLQEYPYPEEYRRIGEKPRKPDDELKL